MIRVALAALAACTIAGAADARHRGGAPPPANVYALYDHDQMNTDTTGKTVVPKPAPGDALFLIGGQSLCANWGPTPYVPVHASQMIQLDIYADPPNNFFLAADPLLGPGHAGGNWISRFADKLLADGKYPRVGVVPICYGGTAVADWAPGGFLNHRLMVAFKRIRQAGLTLTGIIWEEGQTDAQAGTSSADYQARFLQIKETAAGLGFGSVPWIVPIDTMNVGVVSPTIEAAQMALINGTSILAGPNVDVIMPVTQRRDGTHPDDTGEATLGAAFAATVEAHF